MSTRILVSTAAVVLLAASAVAQTAQPATPAAAPAQPAVQVAGAEPAHGNATRDKDTLSVDFPDEDIKTILRNVADLFELNLVVPDTLVGKTSIKLRDVTWRQIFQVVLTPAGYTYVEEGNIIKVVSNEQLGTEPVSTEVFILNNAKAQDIKPTVDGLVDSASGGKILIDSRSNALVVTERPSRMTRIRTIVEQLDKATAQVMIESKFVEVSDSDIRNIGVNWASLAGMRVGVGNISQEWNRGRTQTYDQGTNSNGTTNSTTTTGNNTNTTTSNGSTTTTGTSGGSTTTNTGGTTTSTTVTSQGDLLTFDPTTNVPTVTTIPPIQNNTTTINTPSSQTNTTSGNSSAVSNTNGTNVSTTIANGLSTTATNAVNNLLGLTNGGTQGRLASAVFSASDFNVIISALKSMNETKVVSNPTVVTLNNSEATINVGSEFPIPSYTYNSERGTFEVSGFTYKPVGVILKVTPQVNGQGNIRLALEPEISSTTRETSFGGAGGATIPIIDTRKVKTQVSLKDGYTAGIGGLISTAKSNGGTKVPVLGSIPVLGRLFSSKSVNDRTTNLLIFITAKTVNPDGAAPSDVFTADALKSVGMGGTK